MPRKTTPKEHAGGRWTKARYESFIRSALRRASLRWPVRQDVLKKARRPYTGPNTQQKWEYVCACCHKWVMGKETHIDHITPCGSLRPLDKFVDTLFCEADNLQVICKKCHKTKTHKKHD